MFVWIVWCHVEAALNIEHIRHPFNNKRDHHVTNFRLPIRMCELMKQCFRYNHHQQQQQSTLRITTKAESTIIIPTRRSLSAKKLKNEDKKKWWKWHNHFLEISWNRFCGCLSDANRLRDIRRLDHTPKKTKKTSQTILIWWIIISYFLRNTTFKLQQLFSSSVYIFGIKMLIFIRTASPQHHFRKLDNNQA